MTQKITIAPGTRIEIELTARDKTRETLQCVLVNDDAADFAKGLLSVNTPLAKTILGHTAGETLAYAQGDIVQIKILDVQLAPDAVAADAGEQRDETLRRARDKAELASMVSFALTFDSKWGDYDPEQIVKQYEENQDKPKGDEQ
jgi:hypothetical protein